MNSFSLESFSAKNYFTNKREINGKLVYYKPYLFYVFRMCVLLHLIIFLLLIFALVAFIIMYNFCPRDELKKSTNYKNTTVGSELNIFTKYYKNISMKVCKAYGVTRPEELFANFYDELKILFIFETIFWILYKYVEFVKKFVIRFFSKYNSKKILLISEKRKMYLNRKNQEIVAETDEHTGKLLSIEIPAIFLDQNLKHRNLLLSFYPRSLIYFNLKRFMFYSTWEKMRGSLPPYIDIVIYLRDILKGVQYLHDHKIYHLNICPENILIVPSERNYCGEAKISGFEFAIKSYQRVIDFQKVGLRWLYRPPEYFSKGLLDAKAVDAWSVGVTAYELFTGGYFTIQSENMCNGEKFLEFVQTEGLLNLSYFSSATVSCWNYLSFIGGFNNMVKIDDTIYNLTPFWFLKDSWKFVKGLMNFCPESRYSISTALEMPLITKTINPELFFYIKCCRSQACHAMFIV